MLNRTGGVDRIQRRDMGLVSEAYYGGRSVKVVGVGVHGAQRGCWGHDMRNRWHTCMVPERHGECASDATGREGRLCWSHRDRIFLTLGSLETRSSKTRVHVSTSGGMLGVIRGGNYNSIQGQISQL